MRRHVLSSRLAFGCAIALGVVVACGGSSSSGISSSSSSGSSGTSGATSSSSGGSGTTSSSGSTADGSTTVNATGCTLPADCAWGEIDHEILTKDDCICLFGCPHLPLNKQTVDRRLAQHKALCDPRKNAKGDPCPVDDCAPLKDIDCRDGVCVAPIPDSGHD